MSKVKDMTGKRVGYLEVTGRADPASSRNGEAQWDAKCLLCGNETVVNGHDLRRGRYVACGCVRGVGLVRLAARLKALAMLGKTGRPRDQLVGHKFGRLSVFAPAGLDKRRASMWECRCTCGNVIVAKGSNLKNGNTRSCGCITKELLATYRHAM